MACTINMLFSKVNHTFPLVLLLFQTDFQSCFFNFYKYKYVGVVLKNIFLESFMLSWKDLISVPKLNYCPKCSYISYVFDLYITPFSLIWATEYSSCIFYRISISAFFQDALSAVCFTGMFFFECDEIVAE